MSKRKNRRRELRIHRAAALKATPGSVTIDPAAKKTLVHVLAYGPQGQVEQKLDRVDSLRDLVGKYPVTWVNIDGLGDAATIEKIGEIFRLHRLALEDAVNTHQRAKVDVYENCLFIVARMADLELEAATEQLGMFLGENFVLTFQEEAGDCWEPIRRRIRDKVGKVTSQGADYLAYCLLDAVVDDYYPVLEKYGDELDELEEAIVFAPTRNTLDRLHRLKSDMLLLRRAIRPHRESVAMLARDSTPFVSESTRPYLRDCYDHVIQISDLIESYREVSADLRDLYMSSVSNRINETMRVLTIIATIFIPITFIASVYGMNFEFMPELHSTWGYPLTLLAMAVTTIGMCIYFWKQGWLGSSVVAKEDDSRNTN